ncbi:MAG: hypothetical protein MK135_09575 [Polyangiaceae bacterium]|nr:hypothetical protein [Polyangiaceae bacterium]
MKRRLTSLVALAATFVAAPAFAQMGLEPGAPQAGSLPGGVSPGVESQGKDDWRFDFHGYFTMPFWVGFGQRENPTADQSKTTWHAPPVVPGERGSFAYTNVLPGPWTQLNFSYGTSVVRGTVIIAASTAASAEGFYNPPDHIGIKDAFLTLDLPATETSNYHINAGVFSNRYGLMGEFDEGEYSTPIVSRMDGAGITGTGKWQLGPKIVVAAEAGMMANIDKPVLGTVPEGWNGFADANIGSTYAAHGHLGISIAQFAHINLHEIYSFSKDDQAGVQDQPDAALNVLGADARLTMGPWGHLFVGMSHANASYVGSLGGVVHYLDTANGQDLMRNYLGTQSEGNGKVTTVALQYDGSLASMMKPDEEFSGNAPDLRYVLFGMAAFTDTSDTTNTAPQNRYGLCNNGCAKFGGELTYKPFRYFAAAFRGDEVIQNLDDGSESFAILSPRLIFSSDWNSQDQIVLQYSHYVYGSNVAVRNPAYDPNDNTYTPGDGNTVSLHATMWW